MNDLDILGISLREELQSLQLSDSVAIAQRLGNVAEKIQSKFVPDHSAGRKQEQSQDESFELLSRRQNFGQETSEDPDWCQFLSLLAANEIPVVAMQDLPLLESSSFTGDGAFGQVNFATWTTTSAVVALKKYKPTFFSSSATANANKAYQQLMHDVFFEVEIMGRCKHPNITRILGISFSDSQYSLVEPVLVLEAANINTPDLSKIFDRHTLEIDTIMDIAAGIGNGLRFLHHLGVVHADLKPQNILMFDVDSKWIPKLSDFGLSGITVSKDTPRAGTRRWNPPECLPRAQERSRKHAYAATRDLYSYGLVVSYMILRGNGPFHSSLIDIDEVKTREVDSCFQHIWPRTMTELKDPQHMKKLYLLLKRTLKREPWLRVKALDKFLKISNYGQVDAVPFRGSQVTRSLPQNQYQHLFEQKDISPLIWTAHNFPSTIREALSVQLEQMLMSKKLSEISMTERFLASVFVKANKLKGLAERRPELQALMADVWHLNSDEERLKHIRDFTRLLQANEDTKRKLLSCNALALLKFEAEHGSSARPRGFSIMHLAILAQVSDMITLLASADHDLLNDQDNSLGWSPLHVAVSQGFAKGVQLLIKLGASVDNVSGGSLGWTWSPLTLAVLVGNLKLVELLLEHSDIWIRDYGHMGYTCAHYAAELDEDDILAAIIAHSPNIGNANDQRRRTPLQRAAYQGADTKVSMLLAVGADPSSRDTGHETPLHRAYAAANGYQGLQKLQGYEETADGDFAALYTPELKLTRNSFQLSSVSLPKQIEDFAVHMAEGLGETFENMLGGEIFSSQFENLVGEVPKGHDAFVLLKLKNMARDSSMSVHVLNGIFDVIGERLKAQSSSTELDGLIFLNPVYGTDGSLKKVELNVSEFMKRKKRRKILMGEEKAKGQRGVTYLPLPNGQRTVELLIEKGADVEARGTNNYTPECYAYKPEELIWSAWVDVAQKAQCEPSSISTRVNRKIGPLGDDKTRWKDSDQTLQVDFVRGEFSIWLWLPHTLPCPGTLAMFIRAGRYADPPGVDTTESTIEFEVRMYPPNDAKNKEETLLLKSFRLHELFPEPNIVYVLNIGEIDLGHKCLLLINIRSGAGAAGISGGIAISTIRLVANVLLAPYVSTLLPLQLQKSTGNLSSTIPLVRGIARDVSMPNFPPNTFWMPFKPETRKPKQVPSLSGLIAAVNKMSLKEPNPNVYTRARLGNDITTVPMLYGEKTWHYNFEEGSETHGLTHWQTKLVSDGSFSKLAAKAGRAVDEQTRHLKKMTEIEQLCQNKARQGLSTVADRYQFSMLKARSDVLEKIFVRWKRIDQGLEKEFDDFIADVPSDTE